MADKVIEDLKQLKHCITKPCDITCGYYNAEDMICPCSYDVPSDVAIDNAIQTIRKLHNQIPKWYLVDDGDLPKIDEEVLFIDDFGEIFIGRLHVYDGVKRTWYANYLDDRVKDVIAWMELPKFSEVE